MPAPTAASWLPGPDGGAEEHVVADVLKTTVVIVTVVVAFVADESGPQLAMTLPGMTVKAPLSVEQPPVLLSSKQHRSSSLLLRPSLPTTPQPE